MELVNQNVVVTASHFNLSIITQLWLVRNKIVAEDDLEGSVFTPAFIQCSTKQFNLSIMEERAQFIPREPEVPAPEAFLEAAESLVRTLPHTPYTGIGLNFIWQLMPTSKSVHEIGRRLFFQDQGPLASEFSTSDARYGAYFSKDTDSGRLKLTAMPVTTHSPEKKFESIQFSFNYHTDSIDVNQITQRIKSWPKTKAHSQSIIKTIEESIC